VPSPENERSYAVTRKTLDGERLPRPNNSTVLGLSDELWALIQASWSHEADDQPLLSTFIELLERANPDIAMLKKLTRFDERSDKHINKLRTMFEYGDNTLLGMRKNESLILIEVFDRVSTYSSLSPSPTTYYGLGSEFFT
jgi:hypothetical protein